MRPSSPRFWPQFGSGEGPHGRSVRASGILGTSLNAACAEFVFVRCGRIGTVQYRCNNSAPPRQFQESPKPSSERRPPLDSPERPPDAPRSTSNRNARRWPPAWCDKNANVLPRGRSPEMSLYFLSPLRGLSSVTRRSEFLPATCRTNCICSLCNRPHITSCAAWATLASAHGSSPSSYG